jgi:bifunctional non-homologous end joining protein LigD
MVSWAVPKGPSFDPLEKRMAIHVEDHPISYASFEGTIPAEAVRRGHRDRLGQRHLGAGGRCAQGAGRRQAGVRLHGQKLEGLWELVNIAKGGERQEPWILFKKKDEFARPTPSTTWSWHCPTA